MTPADVLPAIDRRVAPAWSRRGGALRRLVAAFVRRPGAGDGPPDATRYVCPFCGRGYDVERKRCASCDALPVVPREDREVYRAVVAPCGARCAPRGEPALLPPR